MGLIILPLLFAACWGLARFLRNALPHWLSATLGSVVFVVVAGFGVLIAGYFVWLGLQSPSWMPVTILIAGFGVGCILAGNALRATLQNA